MVGELGFSGVVIDLHFHFHGSRSTCKRLMGTAHIFALHSISALLEKLSSAEIMRRQEMIINTLHGQALSYVEHCNFAGTDMQQVYAK